MGLAWVGSADFGAGRPHRASANLYMPQALYPPSPACHAAAQPTQQSPQPPAVARQREIKMALRRAWPGPAAPTSAPTGPSQPCLIYASLKHSPNLQLAMSKHPPSRNLQKQSRDGPEIKVALLAWASAQRRLRRLQAPASLATSSILQVHCSISSACHAAALPTMQPPTARSSRTTTEIKTLH